MKNKKGWIKIVEAFIAIMLVMAVVLIVINRQESQVGDFSSKFREIEISILREIQLNSTMREEILATNGDITLVGSSSEAPITQAKIEEETPENILCQGKICNPQGPCLLGSTQDTSVYAEQVLITSTLETSKPRMLKLFCWEE